MTRFPGVEKIHKDRITRHLNTYRADGETPEVDLLVDVALGDLSREENPGFVATLKKYITYRLTRTRPERRQQVLEIDAPGSITRARLAQFLTPMLQANRFKLWQTRDAPFPASSLGLQKALKQLEAWLRAGKFVLDGDAPWITWQRPDDAGLRAAPRTPRGIEFAQIVRGLMATAHGEPWLPLVDIKLAKAGWGWLKSHDVVLWFACGVHPRLPVADALVSEKSISFRAYSTPPKGSHISGWNRARNHEMRGITITVKDPEAVTPEMLAGLYRAARTAGGFDVAGAPRQRNAEVLRVIELELILDELERQVTGGEVVSRGEWQTWEWRPGPSQLLKVWLERAYEFGCSSDDITTRQGMGRFVNQVSFEEYRDSVRSALSFTQLS